MAKKKCDLIAREKRREEVAEAYMRGETMSTIAERLGCGVATVHRDLQTCRQQWLEKSTAAIETIKAEQLAKIDWIEREAVQAWYRSQQDAESETSTNETAEPASGATENKARVQHTRRGQVGHEKYLVRIGWCVEQRLKIIGAYAPTKIAPVSPDGEVAYHDHILRQLSDEELQTLEVVSARITSASVT